MPEQAPPTVLVVDDDRGLLRLIEKTIRREGYTTATAASGEEALAWIQANSADIMLLDLKLQDMEGKELINHLAAVNRSMPFIIITGQGDERVAVDMMKRGALDYLVKDVQFQEFLPTVVRRALDQVDKERRLAAAEIALRRSEANLAEAQHIAHLGSFGIQVARLRFDHLSDEVYRITGLDRSQTDLAICEYARQVVHPEDRDRFQRILEASARDARPFDFEYRAVRSEGPIRYVHTIGEPAQEGNGPAGRLVGTMLDITERKELEQQLMSASETEQRRIGQDLHDGLSQQLAGIELMCQVLEQKLSNRNRTEAERLGQISRHVREAIAHTRNLARGLSPVQLDAGGLMSALEELVANIQAMFNVECRFECQEPILVHNAAAATHLYRIVQEAINNAIRHGKARKILVAIGASGEGRSLRISNDGIPFPAGVKPAQGMGLRIMNYRAGEIGATLQVHSNGAGTTVHCEFSGNL
jgi:PAS domain S-box-containing protein